MNTLGRVLLLVWVPLVMIVIGLLMVNHTIAMPSPDRPELLQAALLELDEGPDVTVHIIYANCSCTDLLVEHLISRRANPSELVLYVGEPRPSHTALSTSGFKVIRLLPGELETKLGLEAAPVLLALRGGTLAYAGGYFRYPAAVRPLDVSIVQRIDQGEAVKGLPIFGCAVSPRLQRQVDPLGLQR